MRRLARHILLCATLCYSLLSCRVHEWPEHPIPTVDVDLTMTFDIQMPELIHIQRATEFATTDPDDYDVRYIVKAYPVTSSGETLQTEVATEIWSKPNVNDELNERRTIMLPPGRYHLYAWVDYVDNDSLDDKFYNTSSDKGFKYVSLITPEPETKLHPANNHFRDLFVGDVEVVVEPEFELDLPPVEAHIDMSRPLAMFQFITDDLDEFVSRVLEQRANEAAANGITLPESELVPSSVDLAEYKVRIQYDDFMPSTFNLFDNEPVDAKQNIIIESAVTPIGDGEAVIGFDYTFILGQSTEDYPNHPRFSVYLYNKDNKLISAARKIEVPLERSKYTTIRGSFMTQSASGGVNINPGFTDEHNYIVGDN